METIRPSAASTAHIAERIVLIRGHRVLLDGDLASLYDVETRTLVQAVKRNLDRFPADFMFQLTNQELAHLRSQFVISSWGGRRYVPYAFTEQGVAMLSSVLNSSRALAVNIEIMRTFVRLRETLTPNTELGQRLDELEKRLGTHDHAIAGIIDAIRQLATPAESKRPSIGFVRSGEK